MVMEMLRAGEVREDDDQYQSPLDELFEQVRHQSLHIVIILQIYKRVIAMALFHVAGTDFLSEI